MKSKRAAKDPVAYRLSITADKRARAVIDQFNVAMSTEPQAIAKRETKVLRQYLDGACRTKRVDEVETPVFMEARGRLAGKM